MTIKALVTANYAKENTFCLIQLLITQFKLIYCNVITVWHSNRTREGFNSTFT